jgi:hypothetical protein
MEMNQNSGGERLDQGLSFSLHHEIAVPVMPAEAGIQGWRGAERGVIDSRFAGMIGTRATDYVADCRLMPLGGNSVMR